MMELLNFLAQSAERTIVGLVVLVILSIVFCFVVSQPFRIAMVLTRGRNISKHGWPPPHCDADGDPREEPKAEEAE